MKTKSVALFLALTTSIAGLAVGLLAADTPPPAKTAPVKKPVLKFDSSPIGENKTVVTSYADVLESIRPAVVSVTSSKIVRQEVPEFLRRYGMKGAEQKMGGLGSGVIVSPDGYIITNNHVVADADELKVLLDDGREFTAKVIGTDPKTDVAVIKIEADHLPVAILADSSKLRVGDVVFAIGNPLGVGQTVTMGIVSATGRRVGILDDVAGYEDFIQTDAAINQGNSGGALIDAKGRLVGINSAIISNSSGNIGIGFAIPIKLVDSIMNSLIATGTVSRGYLGVSTAPLTPDLVDSFGLKPETKGVIITDVNPNSGSTAHPAADAGLKREDVVTGVDDQTVTSPDDLRLIIAQTPPGTKISVKYLRDGKPQSTEVTLGKLPDDSSPDGELISGVSIASLTPDLRKELRIDDRVEGIVITAITDNSPFRDNFPQGAVIEQLNRVTVTDLASAKQALRDGRNIALVYYRGVYRYVMFNTRG